MKKTGNYLAMLVLMAAALLFTHACKDTDVEPPAGPAEVLSVSFAGMNNVTGTPVIDNNKGEITFYVTSETTQEEMKNIAPVFELPEGVAISPLSGVPQDFTNGPVTYTVTSLNGQTKKFKINCIRNMYEGALITSMSIDHPAVPTAELVIPEEGNEIVFYIEYGTDLSTLDAVVPEFTISVGATVTPEQGEAVDFSATDEVEYIVTSESGQANPYRLKMVTLPNEEALMLTFDFETNSIVEVLPDLGSAVPNPDDGVIELVFFVKYDTPAADIDNLVPVITVSQDATVSPLSGSKQNFSQGPVEYTVTAQDGVTKTVYSVRYEELASAEANILTFTIDSPIVESVSPVPVYDDSPGATTNVITYKVAKNAAEADIMALVPAITISKGATMDYTAGNPLGLKPGESMEIKVTSNDTENIQTYTVKCEKDDNDESELTDFAIVSEMVVSLDRNDNVIDVVLNANIQAGTNYNFNPTFGLSPYATASPASGDQITVNFAYITDTVTKNYTVTAQDGVSTTTITVNFTRELSTATVLTFTGLNDGSGVVYGEIVEAAGTDAYEFYVVPDASAGDIAAVTANYTQSPGATVQVSSGTFGDKVAITYTVTAESGASQVYTLTCHKLKKTFYDFENWTNVESGRKQRDEPDGWATANDGIATIRNLQMTGTRPDFVVIPNDAGRNGRAMQLTTRRITYLFSPTGITAGSAFLGVFDTVMSDPMSSTQFGVEYHYKPINVKGYYTYKKGDVFYDNKDVAQGEDMMALTALLYKVDSYDEHLTGHNVNDSPNIVARTNITDGTEVATFTEFNLPLQYTEAYNRDQKYKFTILFSSSYLGADYKGAPNSTLILDDVEVWYVDYN